MTQNDVEMLVLYVAVEKRYAKTLGQDLADKAIGELGLHVYGFEERDLTREEWVELECNTPT